MFYKNILFLSFKRIVVTYVLQNFLNYKFYIKTIHTEGKIKNSFYVIQYILQNSENNFFFRRKLSSFGTEQTSSLVTEHRVIFENIFHSLKVQFIYLFLKYRVL